jgi:hypothetical protein
MEQFNSLTDSLLFIISTKTRNSVNSWKVHLFPFCQRVFVNDYDYFEYITNCGLILLVEFDCLCIWNLFVY